MNPQFPLYIPSKGRFNIRLTSDYLSVMGVPHNIVVEEQEYDDYLSETKDNPYVTLLILDKKYQDEYETFDTLGDTKSKGPGAARNFAWDHSTANGFSHHWVMDDNIMSFRRMNKNRQIKVSTGAIFKAMEDFVLRYKNVAMAGPQYFMFAPRKAKLPPFTVNTRIYSCNFIKNDVPFRWRGRYNEDTDLSLQMLKKGYCTIQFNAFLQDKTTTQLVKGGNTKEFYAKEGTMPKSKLLVAMHPDVCKIVWKFKRWHHYCDYNPFKKNALIKVDGYKKKTEREEYGMVIHNK